MHTDYLTKEALEGFKYSQVGKVIRTLKYADDVVLLVKEETVLLAMIKRLIEIGGRYGMEMNVEKLK